MELFKAIRENTKNYNTFSTGISYREIKMKVDLETAKQLIISAKNNAQARVDLYHHLRNMESLYGSFILKTLERAGLEDPIGWMKNMRTYLEKEIKAGRNQQSTLSP